MFGKIIKLALALGVIIAVTSCGKSDETHEENRLLYSFRHESPELQRHIAEIIEQANRLDYKEAMNKLAILSATRTLNREQQHAVDILVRQLRYDMEEEIFLERPDRNGNE